MKIWTSGWTAFIGIAILVIGSLHQWLIGHQSLEDVAHIALPLAVLWVEFYMLGRMRLEALHRIEESNERKSVMTDLDAFRVALGRAHYFQELERGIRHANTEIMFTARTMATSAAEDQRRLIRVVNDMESRVPGIVHQGLVAKHESTLAGAVELVKRAPKTQLRFHSVAGRTGLRFQVVDRNLSVIGVAEPGDGETKKSFSIESMFLAEALRDRFQKLWNEATDLWHYFDEEVKELLGTETPAGSALTQANILTSLLRSDVTGVTVADIPQSCQTFHNLRQK